jgi:hypothetical protein
MFESKVDMRSRKAMINFLVSHYRYSTLNAWNGSTSYANNVKVHRLDIPKELRDKAWDFVLTDADMWELECEYQFLIDEFKDETGYDAGFNGRSGGYLVLYDTGWDYSNGKATLVTYPGRSIDSDDPELFEDWGVSELRERVKIVQRFDKLCDDMRTTFIYYLENYELVDEEYTEVKTRHVLSAMQ